MQPQSSINPLFDPNHELFTAEERDVATVLETKYKRRSMTRVSLLLPTMNACKTLDNDGCSSEVSWLQGGMLPAAPLTIVGIPNDHPGYATGL